MTSVQKFANQGEKQYTFSILLLVGYYWYIDMSTATNRATTEKRPRVRLSREERLRQLLAVSWKLVSAGGTDGLTLGRLAEEAGVTKPVVYDHFGTRNALLAALYQDFDVRQTAIFDAALITSGPSLDGKAGVIASCYVDCVLTQGREIPGVLAALNGSPELAAVKKHYQRTFIEKCQKILAPFAGKQGVSLAAMWAILGAADSLSNAAAEGEISPMQAQGELREIIVTTVTRN